MEVQMGKLIVLVSCGTGIATSTVVAVEIAEAMQERGLDVETRQCKTAEIPGRVQGVDLIVTTNQFTGDYGIPAITSLAFLTGIGKGPVLDQIEKTLREALAKKAK
jgi:galactitol PTS system EIIB component